MKTILLLFLIIPVLAQPPEKPVTNFNPLNRMAGKTTASIDRKYGDHAGNRILCRFFNFVVFGMYGDADVGSSSDFHDDDAWWYR